MKLIACGDLHFVEENPEKRIDDYSNALFNKWQYISNYAFNKNISIVICPGDIFETHRASNNLIAKVIDYFKNMERVGLRIFSIFGQHDLAHRSEENSPLNVLEAANVITILDNNPYKYDNYNLYGCSFNEKVPNPITDNNILVIHKMISDKDYWYGSVKYTQSENFIDENTKYKIIISGDNHQTFSVKYNESILLNAGSLGRKRIDQIDHKPCFFVIDTDTLDFEQIFIPIVSSKKVFDLAKVINKETENKSLDRFIETLPKYTIRNDKINYPKYLLEYIETNQIEEGPANIIDECLVGIPIE